MDKICEFCSGSGQINYFKGVSRFLISTDECPECGGLGFIPDETLSKSVKKSKRTKRKKTD